MKEIEILIDIQISRSRANLIYQLLGEFGDRLTKDVQSEMRKQAEKESNRFEALNKRIINTLK